VHFEECENLVRNGEGNGQQPQGQTDQKKIPKNIKILNYIKLQFF
jgi:hypothetical protein